MAFDGRAHGVGNLITPYVHHPSAPALGEGLAAILRHTYSVARKARLIGQQGSAPVYLDTSGPRLSTGEYLGVGAFLQVDRPAWATHVLAELRYHLDPTEQATLSHRLTVTDGSGTDLVTASENVDRADQDEPQDPHRVSVPALVALSNVGSSTRLDVTLETHASSPSAGVFNGFEFRPELATAWWVTLG